MPTYALYAVDLVAICVLVFGLFLPRHQRPELIVAFLTVNVGVLAVTAVLSGSTIGAGLGLGLFGILSIIRLRSEELTQTEVAYYFAALALGLLGGLGAASWHEAALMAVVVAAVAIGDSPRIGRRADAQQLLLDRALVDHDALVAHLEVLLDATVVTAKVLRTDLVDDTTLVDVRSRRTARPAGTAGASGAKTADVPALEMLR